MRLLFHRRVLFSALALGVLLALLVDLCHHQQSKFNPLTFVRRPAGVQTRDDAALLSGWLEQVENSWEVGKNHQRVRSAFRDAVADARRATVRILRGDRQVALGTVVDPAGYVLTKASEVAGDAPIVCQFFDRRKRTAQRVGTLESHDLVMLKVEIDGLTAPKWCTAEDAPAVGSLLATPELGRDPLAVGVVSLAPQHVANDGVLGIQLRNGSDGPLVSEVFRSSAAESAGLRTGDVVLRVDDQAVADSDQLVRVIGQRLPGDTVALSLRRDGTDLQVQAKLGRRTDLDEENSDFQSFLGGELSFRRSGFSTVLQHDTFLLPEHCGGPVCDLEGRVVGINIARAERIASYALPAAEILPWLDGLKAGKYDSLAVGRQRPDNNETAHR